jgi:CheY-like chemotaxis protein
MNQRLLMIEDDARPASMLGEYPRQNGYAVVLAADAEQGLAALQIHSFDLLLLDLVLPDADGFALCRGLRVESAISSGVPIITTISRSRMRKAVLLLESAGPSTGHPHCPCRGSTAGRSSWPACSQGNNAVIKSATAFGGIDLLVANVGGSIAGGLLEATFDDWRHTFDLNLLYRLFFA